MPDDQPIQSVYLKLPPEGSHDFLRVKVEDGQVVLTHYNWDQAIGKKMVVSVDALVDTLRLFE